MCIFINLAHRAFDFTWKFRVLDWGKYACHTPSQQIVLRRFKNVIFDIVIYVAPTAPFVIASPLTETNKREWGTLYHSMFIAMKLEKHTLIFSKWTYRPIRVFVNGPGDWGSIPGRFIDKTQKMVLDASLLNTKYYKVRIKEQSWKVEQSRERSSAFLYTSVLELIEKGVFGSPSTTVSLFT